MPPLSLWMRGGKRDGWGNGCRPNLEAALQQDTATRREEMDGRCLEAGCRAHIGLAMAKLVALKILEKDQGKS